MVLRLPGDDCLPHGRSKARRPFSDAPEVWNSSSRWIIVGGVSEVN